MSNKSSTQLETVSSPKCVNPHLFQTSMRSLGRIVVLVLLLLLFQWNTTASSQTIGNSLSLTRNTLKRWHSCVPKETLQLFTLNLNFVVAYNYVLKFPNENLNIQLQDTIAYMNSILEPQIGIRVALNKVFINTEPTTHAFNTNTCPTESWKFTQSIYTWFEDRNMNDEIDSDKGIWFVYSDCFQYEFFQVSRNEGTHHSQGLTEGLIVDPCGGETFHNIPFMEQNSNTKDSYGRSFNMQHITLKIFAQVFGIAPTVYHGIAAFANGGCMDYNRVFSGNYERPDNSPDMNDCRLRQNDQDNADLDGFHSTAKDRFCETLTLSIQNAANMGNLADPSTANAKNSCWIAQTTGIANNVNYSWQTGDWETDDFDTCLGAQSPCGEYPRRRKVTCISDKSINGVPMVGLDIDCDAIAKPPTIQPCMEIPPGGCPYIAKATTDWGSCSSSDPCILGTQTRTIACFAKGSNTPEPDQSKCPDSRYLHTRSCVGPGACRGAAWEPAFNNHRLFYCSVSFNSSRNRKCIRYSQVVDPLLCGTKKQIQHSLINVSASCNTRAVERSWTADGWSSCSPTTTTESTCGLGKKSISAACQSVGSGIAAIDLPSSLCSASFPDTIYDDCLVGGCDGYSWEVSEWSACSATSDCDIGERTRTLTCLLGSTAANNPSDCDHLPKFRTTEDCYNALTCKLSISSITASEDGVNASNGLTMVGDNSVPRYSPFGTLSITIAVQKASILPSPKLLMTLLNQDFSTFSYYLGAEEFPSDGSELKVNVDLSTLPILLRENDSYYIQVQAEDYISKRSESFGFTDSCSAIECPPNTACDGVLLTCDCINSWVTDLDHPSQEICTVCSLQCNGSTSPNSTCSMCCDPGYNGDDCSIFTCNDSLCDKGQCNTQSGSCECSFGWTGDQCDTACPSFDLDKCAGHGVADETALSCSTLCKCDNRWVTNPDLDPSVDLQCTRCDLDCGESLHDSDCTKCCEPGYSGDNCSTFNCNTFPCKNGACVSETEPCRCDNDWMGETCEEKCPVNNCSDHGEVNTSDPSCTTCKCSNSWITDRDYVFPSSHPQCSVCPLECNFESPYDLDCSMCLCKPNSYGKTCPCRYVTVSFTLSDKVDIDKVSEIVEKIVDELAVLGKIDRALIEIVSSSTNHEFNPKEVQLRFLADSPCLDVDVDVDVDVEESIANLSSNITQRDTTEYTLENSYEALRLIGESFSKRFEGQDITSITPTLRSSIDFTSQLFIEDQLCIVEPCPVSVSPPGLAPVPEPEPEKDNSLSTGEIAGIVLGCIAFLVVLCLLIVLVLVLKKRRENVRENKTNDDVHNMELTTQK